VEGVHGEGAKTYRTILGLTCWACVCPIDEEARTKDAGAKQKAYGAANEDAIVRLWDWVLAVISRRRGG
jgi:hypothetical protein